MRLSFAGCSDRDLLVEVSRLAASEREATARLVASLAEVDVHVRCGLVTVGGARLSVVTADAPRRGFWNFTMSCRMRMEGRHRWRIWSFAVGRTTRTRLRSTSAQIGGQSRASGLTTSGETRLVPERAVSNEFAVGNRAARATRGASVRRVRRQRWGRPECVEGPVPPGDTPTPLRRHTCLASATSGPDSSRRPTPSMRHPLRADTRRSPAYPRPS